MKKLSKITIITLLFFSIKIDAMSNKPLETLARTTGIKNIFYNLPTLETKQLILRKITMLDAQQFFTIHSNAEVARHLHYDSYEDLNQTKQYIDTILSSYKKGNPAPWAIVLKKNNEVIGYTGFINVSYEHRWGEICGILAPEYWGKGLMIESARATCLCGFYIIGLNKVKTLMRADNKACIRLHEKEGFSCDGILRQEEYKNDNYHDMKEFSLLREEYVKKIQTEWKDDEIKITFNKKGLPKKSSPIK